MTPRDRLVATARALASRHAAKLAGLKAEHVGLQRHDFVWHYLLQSLSTRGSSRGYEGLMLNMANDARVTYDALFPLSDADRVVRAEAAFRAAKMRMPAKKARWLAANVERVRALGGLAAARRALLAAPGAAGKIAFLKQFDGVGEKYARNMMMDVYHPDFHDNVAIDVHKDRLFDRRRGAREAGRAPRDRAGAARSSELREADQYVLRRADRVPRGRRSRASSPPIPTCSARPCARRREDASAARSSSMQAA